MAERPRARPPSPADKASGSKATDSERAAMAELVEVERAIAALEGRNVDNAEHLVVLRRDAQVKRAALERVIASGRADMARRRRLLPVKVALVLAALGVTAYGTIQGMGQFRAQTAENDLATSAVTSAAKPFEGRFSVARTITADSAFSVHADEGQCLVVLAAGAHGGAKVRIEREGVSREAAESVGFCACKGEDASVTLTGPAPLAALVLTAPMASIGGADALASVTPRPGAVFAETVDRACAEAAFDTWAATQHPEPIHPDLDTLGRPERSLLASGLTMVGFGAADAPFVLAPKASDACVVALSRAGSGLAFHKKGAEKQLSAPSGALGLCAKDLTGLSVWREGSGEVALFAAPRARIGGLLGLREAAARAGVSIVVWSPPAELDDDAGAALTASGIALSPGGPAAGRALVFAFSTDQRSTLTPSSAGPDVVCRPPLDVGAMQAFCVEARASALEASAKLPPGTAKGPVPLWLALPDKPDRASLERGLELLVFARRMSAEGFELTSLVGATLTGKGAEVTGRSGEKEIVGLVVSSAAPFVHTLYSDTPWTMADPRPVPLAAGETINLQASPKYTGVARREFVIWRR